MSVVSELRPLAHQGWVLAASISQVSQLSLEVPHGSLVVGHGQVLVQLHHPPLYQNHWFYAWALWNPPQKELWRYIYGEMQCERIKLQTTNSHKYRNFIFEQFAHIIRPRIYWPCERTLKENYHTALNLYTRWSHDLLTVYSRSTHGYV